MKSLVIYDKSSHELLCDTEEKIPKFCKECLKNKNRKCKKYYDEIFENQLKGIHKCPYGFYSFYNRNTIYTCIITKDYDQKVKKNIESQSQKIKDFDIYTRSQIISLITDIEQLIMNNIEFRDCIHDLRNIGSYFNSMTEAIDARYHDLMENDDNLKAITSLYDLINYRLNVLEGPMPANNRRIYSQIYPQLMKLKLTLRYQASKRKIKINLSPNQDNILILTNNVYLVMFILLENAIKHSISKDCININFSETSEYTEVSISNITNSVSVDETEKIFERGYRGKSCISKGTGVGLSLVKEILTSLNYEYGCEIKKNDNYTNFFEFHIKFPVAKK